MIPAGVAVQALPETKIRQTFKRRPCHCCTLVCHSLRPLGIVFLPGRSRRTLLVRTFYGHLSRLVREDVPWMLTLLAQKAVPKALGDFDA